MLYFYIMNIVNVLTNWLIKLMQICSVQSLGGIFTFGLMKDHFGK